MASSLSEDEFQRMQLQLLELRENNYQLSDSCKRQERELIGLRDQVKTLDNDLQKANKAISKSKKAREMEQLLQENDSFQRKLVSQEEEFRLQNETLMQELSTFVTTNENLERELQSLKEKTSSGTVKEVASSEQLDEIRHLQAQNSALQKNLTGTQEKYEAEAAVCKQRIHELEMQCMKLAGQRSPPLGEGSTERMVEGESDQDTVSEDHVDGPDNIEDSVNDNKPSNESVMNLVNQTESTNHQLGEQIKQLNDLRLSLDTEQEEKRILKKQLQETENSYQDKIKALEEELEKVTEKYKKKQESLVQLQEEKESMYSELSQKLSETQTARQREVQQLTDQYHRLQEDHHKVKKAFDDHKMKAGHRLRELDHTIMSLRSQVDSATLESNQQLVESNLAYRDKQEEMQLVIDELRQEHGDLQLQIQESQKAAQTTLEQLYDAQQERDRQIQALQEANKVAEKRKSILDDLAIKYQKESDEHREKVKGIEEQHRNKVHDLSEELGKLQEDNHRLRAFEKEAEELRAKVVSLEETKGWLERRLGEVEDSLETTKTEYQSMMDSHREEHEQSLLSINEEHELEVSNLQSNIEELNQSLGEKESAISKLKQDHADAIVHLRQEHQSNVDKLRQELKDGVDMKKIHEKKGASMLKDLKRQLMAERKRAEKLQERLQEVLSDSKNRHSVEELFKPIDQYDHYSMPGDNSSVSSYSVSGVGGKDPSTAPTSPGPNMDSPSPSLEAENNDLVQRLAEVQQEKWSLEERVSHLEASNAAMADDILRKTAIIEHYNMEVRADPAMSPLTDKMTLKRVVDFVMDKGDASLRDMNQKLHRVLEETLTKNMHLQKDLETLSQEVVRLSKTSTPPVEQ